MTNVVIGAGSGMGMAVARELASAGRSSPRTGPLMPSRHLPPNWERM